MEAFLHSYYFRAQLLANTSHVGWPGNASLCWITVRWWWQSLCFLHCRCLRSSSCVYGLYLLQCSYHSLLMTWCYPQLVSYTQLSHRASFLPGHYINSVCMDGFHGAWVYFRKPRVGVHVRHSCVQNTSKIKETDFLKVRSHTVATWSHVCPPEVGLVNYLYYKL